MNNWKDIDELIEYPQEGILSKEILKNEKVNITLFCLAKGAELTEHTSTKAGQVFVLEGEGIFILAGEKIKMRKGVFIALPAAARHSLKAEDNTAFILFLNN